MHGERTTAPQCISRIHQERKRSDSTADASRQRFFHDLPGVSHSQCGSPLSMWPASVLSPIFVSILRAPSAFRQGAMKEFGEPK